MFLKRIQANGFKSFADKVSIPFDRGITGIVGPNGSGKSNVIDAVRWVMGEQNAKNLRGKIATDIIFSGSANRKPLGMAEVCLTFDNNDESAFCPPEYRHETEITLTRRLYIDGHREYLINKKPCRLKDIVSFFATTGLGGRSYSMIQQGQVDRILNAKPEEIRVILEEAAGTMVYKKRRDEALKKLGQTQENLSRIEDIVIELERQQDHLKGQMEKAKTWKENSDNLHEKELSLFAHNFHFYNDQLLAFQTEIDSQLNDEVDLIASSTNLEAKQLELQSSLDEADPGLEGLRESVSTVREQIARAENVITGTDDKVSGRKERLDALNIEIDEDSINLKTIESQFQASQEELSAARQKSDELTELIESFQDQVDAVDEEAMVYTSRIEDYEDELKNIDRLLESNTLKCENINRERDKIDTEVKTLNERIDVLNKDITGSKNILDVVEARAATVQDGLDEELTAKSTFEQNIKEREERLQDLSVERDSQKEKYFDTRARYTSLQEVVANASDVASTVTTLKEEEGDDNSCLKLGLLTDYISFKEEIAELSQHARVSIEKWSERLLVNDLDELNDLVRLAHKHEMGGFPVTVLSQWEKGSSEKIQRWVDDFDAVKVSDYLKFTKEHTQLSEVLDRLYLIQTLNLTQDEITELPEGIIVFTTQGIHFNRRDEFVVGLTNDSKGVLSRKQELESLVSELKTTEASLAGCQSELDSLRMTQSEEKLQLQEIDERLQGQNKDVLEVTSELQSVRQLVEHKSELLTNSSEQRDGLVSHETKLVAELSEQGQSRLTFADEQERISRELEEIREESTGIEERRSEVFRVHEARKMDQVKSETRAQSLEQSFAQTNTQLERIQQILTRRYEEKARIEQELDAIQGEYQMCMAEMEQLLTKREAMETDLSSKNDANKAIITELREVDLELKSVREKYGRLEKFVNKKKIDMERLKVAIEGITEQAQEKYHLEISTYEFEREENFDDKKTHREVNRLRNKIESLGAINMMAIDEYDELMTRLEFIRAQREEVFNAINLLEDALEEIEETSKNKFLETYKCISKEFSSLFPVLFPGGEARLDLTDPDDPLNAGVEIMARLPGKKTQRMTLLSGGEKALTAISLIFALLKTKPTPFCFLDEVDAPLDEANVGRYNRVLEILAERFQFVVITHNRRTMEVLDTLYGVTMQEPGVSKIVGVDMKKDLPKHLQKAFKEEEKAEDRAGASVQ